MNNQHLIESNKILREDNATLIERNDFLEKNQSKLFLQIRQLKSNTVEGEKESYLIDDIEAEYFSGVSDIKK